MSHTPTPPRPLATWLRRHWLAVCAGTLVIGLLAANTPAWAAPVARPVSRLKDWEELSLAGVRPETVRLSVGIESVEDLIKDLDQAIAKATAGVGAPA